MAEQLNKMEKLVSLCKRRGFIFPSSEIYGGLSSCWDYGPLGVAMKRNIKDAWWHTIVQSRDDVVGIDTSILMHPRVWEASGHLSGFSDPLVECKKCNLRFRADELKEQLCTACGSPLSDPRQFNLMFKTFMGPVEDAAAVVYMRPETAQGIFVNFENVLTSTRKKLPLGIAQQGKSFRNEITTGNLIFRSREFEQMELEFFVKPGTDMEWFDYWVNARMEWYIKLGIKPENLRLRPHPKEDLAHYALCCTDVEYRFPWNWGELEGIANRGDFDLKQHSKYSGKGLSYFDESISATIVPYVIEPSAGVDRSMLAFLADAYDEEPDKDEVRVVLRLNPIIAPVKVAVLPLSKKDTLTPLAQQIYCDLRQSYAAVYDDSQSIGRRYRRQDETGTPYCVTVDFQSLEDQAVTIRERDSMKQERIAITELKAVLSERLAI